MEQLRSVAKCCKTTASVLSKDPPRTLRWASAISGFLLSLSGLVGVFTINPLAAIISVYNIFFGILIVLTELKTLPVIRTFQKRVDVYFHLLSVPRGKGGFYCFIGLLAFFAEDGYISLTKICVLIVSIVGLIHLFACKRCGAMTDEEFAQADSARQQHEMQGMVSASEDGGKADSSSSSVWADLMKQVVTDSPEVLSAGLSAATANPAATSFAASAAASAMGGAASGNCGGGVPVASTPAYTGTAADDPPSCNRSSTL